MKECLLYVFSGFLESGKTTLIKETLSDPAFQSNEKNLIILCEEGEVAYEESFLNSVNANVIQISALEEMNASFLAQCQEVYHPDRVLIECNGMWSVDALMDIALPTNWILVQILSTVDASTFSLYLANMQSLVYEQLRYSETIIFNRCDTSTQRQYLRNNIKAMNRMAQIIYENKDGTIMQMGKETLPFDKEANHLNILDEDYGVWYMDALEHPYDYEGKTITYVAKVYPMLSPMENRYVLGREAMVCCSDDTSLIGLWVIGKEERPVTGSWVKITGKVTIEYDMDYGGEVCVIEELSREVVNHEEDYVYFT